jgi:hypothetical protein
MSRNTSDITAASTVSVGVNTREHFLTGYENT